MSRPAQRPLRGIAMIAAAIAVPLLGERVTPRYWLHVALGFAGIIVVLRPPPDIFGWSVVPTPTTRFGPAGWMPMRRGRACAGPTCGTVVYGIDMRACPNCGLGTLEPIATILARVAIDRILAAIGLQPRAPPA